MFFAYFDASPLDLKPAPNWSVFTGDLGRGLVLASAILFALAILAWLFAPASPRLRTAGNALFAAGCASVVGTFLSLAILFANNRFEYEYVWGHADTKNALGYRIAGIWSGQEGSFLLWALASALFGLAALWRLGTLQRWYSIAYSAFLGTIMGILAYESPFKTILFEGRPVVPAEGQGLAPSLQNYWVIIHPPIIFLGFGSLTVLFAIGFAALADRNYDGWAPLARPWAILSTTLVGLGLCMGGFWAYETLGWGGFWMWDPVENVSFVPWCMAAALIHGIVVQITKGKWKMGNLLMAGLPFLTFGYGTFLTRSGMLADASVHSFAEMDRSALKLLIGICSLTAIAYISLWLYRTVQERKSAALAAPEGAHREGFFRWGALFLIGMGLATMIGMSVPFLMALQGKSPKVVEEKLYHLVLPWLFVPIMILMAIAPFVRWNGMASRDLAKRVYSILCVSVGLTGFVFLGIVASPLGKLMDLTGSVAFPLGIQVPAMVWILVLLWLCLFVIVSSAWRLADLGKGSKLGWAPFLTHAGVAVLMAGLIVSRGFERKQQTIVLEQAPGRLLNYGIRYDGMTSLTSDRENKVKLAIYDPHKTDEAVLFTAMPGLYYIEREDGAKDPMLWPHVQRFPLYDIYVTLHPPRTELTDEVALKPGMETNIGGFAIKYQEMVREGESGKAGTRFGAKLKVTTPHGSFEAIPKLELGTGGALQIPAKLDDQFRVAVTSMDAATKSVNLQIQLASQMYPVEVYIKPFTGLVWLGTGLMGLGGFLTAYYRRVAVKKEAVRAAPIGHSEPAPAPALNL